jgi:DNA-binding transcriptional LysR family regulator
VLVARLSQSVASTAPLVDLVIRPSTRLDLTEQLDVGRIDLVIGIFAQVPERFSSWGLWRQQDALIMRTDHPCAHAGPQLTDLVRYPLVSVSLGGEEEGAVDGFIVEHGLARQSEMFDRNALDDALTTIGAARARMRVTVPHSLAVPSLLEGTDMLSIVPLPLARHFARMADVVIAPLPYDAPIVTVRMVWHRRNDDEPAHQWLRRQIIDLSPPDE